MLTLCSLIDSVPSSTQVTLLMTSSPSFPISGVDGDEGFFNLELNINQVQMVRLSIFNILVKRMNRI